MSLARDTTQPQSVESAQSVQTRCIIVNMAERLFREIGYRKTTVADIARALRMSPANVYRFFDSKKSINEAVAERMIGEVDAALDRIADDCELSAAERLRAILLAMHRMHVDQFTGDRRMHEMVEAAMTESWDVVHRHIVRVDAILSRVIADGIATGELRAGDPGVAARCVHSAMLRFCHPTLLVQCADEPSPSIGEMCDFILTSLTAR